MERQADLNEDEVIRLIDEVVEAEWKKIDEFFKARDAEFVKAKRTQATGQIMASLMTVSATVNSVLARFGQVTQKIQTAVSGKLASLFQRIMNMLTSFASALQIENWSVSCTASFLPSASLTLTFKP